MRTIFRVTKTNTICELFHMLIISVTHFLTAEFISYSELNSFMSCLGELFMGVEKPHMLWIIYGTTPFHVILMHTPERNCHPFAVPFPGDRVPTAPPSSSLFFSPWKTNPHSLYGQFCSHHQLTMSNREHWNVCPKESRAVIIDGHGKLWVLSFVVIEWENYCQ